MNSNNYVCKTLAKYIHVLAVKVYGSVMRNEFFDHLILA